AFGSGSHSILVRVIDSTQCEATCSTSIFVAQVEDPPFPPVSGCISVLQLGAAKVSITGPAGGILGDVAISPKGIMSMTGDQYVSGTIMLGSGATFANSSHGTAQVARNVDLSGEINNAYAMAGAAVVDGTVLAPLRKIALSPGLVNGAVISAKDISIVSGASVRCPASP